MATSKRVEFHQADIRVTVRVVNAEKSYGTQAFSTTILLNTEAEWANARKRIDEALEQMQRQLEEAEGNDGDGD